MIKKAFAEKPLAVTILVVSCFGLLDYTSIRASVQAFTHDESFSYLHAVAPGFVEALTLSFRDANNHPLNTWGMYICSKLFGKTEFSLRLPNLLAHGVYLFASAMFVWRLPGTLALVTAFLVLNVNVMLLDYFSLARGYGIGLGFLMLASWLCLESLFSRSDKQSLVFAALALLAATFSVVANYTFVHFYAALCVCMTLGWLLKQTVVTEEGGRRDRSFAPIGTFLGATLLNSALLFLVIGRRMLKLKQAGAFYIGGTTGFWQDTIESVIRHSLRAPAGTVRAVEIGLLIIACLNLYVVWRAFVKRGSLSYSIPYMSVTGMVIFTSMTAWLQGVLSEVGYLSYRTAIQFVPLLAFLVVFAVGHYQTFSSRIVRYGGSGFCALVLCVLTMNFLRNANITYTPEWHYDADTKAMISDLAQEYGQRYQGRTIRLGISWELEPSINFYRAVKKLSWLQPVTRDGLEGTYDYYYYRPQDAPHMAGRKVEIIRTYPVTGNRLVRTAME
jgi:hypothetical protein